MTKCEVRNCGRQAKVGSLCDSHYDEWAKWKWHAEEARGPKAGPLSDRINRDWENFIAAPTHSSAPLYDKGWEG